jgi:hypothetical protein
LKKHTIKKWSNLQLAFKLGFWVPMTICNSFVIQYNSMYFYKCECYWTSYMSCNRCNSSYVKQYTYATCTT